MMLLFLYSILSATTVVFAQQDVSNYVGYYQWMATFDGNGTGIAFPQGRPNSAGSHQTNSFRIFARSDATDESFSLQGAITSGNEFVVNYYMSPTTGQLQASQDAYSTEFVCYGANCEAITETALQFEAQVVSLLKESNEIFLVDDNTLYIQGLNGRIEGQRVTDPLLKSHGRSSSTSWQRRGQICLFLSSIATTLILISQR
jgi:hypothetical protein